MTTVPTERLLEMTTNIVAAFVSRNTIVQGNIPDLIRETYNELRAAANSQAVKEEIKLAPAVPIKKSVQPEYIVCLEDGKKFKSLKRHLRTHYSLSPEQYREKWGLNHDYPMVAPNYASARSQLAKTMGLGTRRK